MPTVFDVIASSMAWISIKLSTPISTGIGTPPAILIAEAVANIVWEEIITSSPYKMFHFLNTQDYGLMIGKNFYQLLIAYPQQAGSF
jgi:hypothetical protein